MIQKHAGGIGVDRKRQAALEEVLRVSRAKWYRTY